MTAVAIPQLELEQMQALASWLPGDDGELFAKMIFGRGLGMGPAESLSQIDFVKGKCELSANAQASRMRAYVGPWDERYDYKVAELTNDRCVLRFWRLWPSADREDEFLGESSFSMADAKTAGIAGGMYSKYARNMLLSRAMSNGVAWFAPETTYGVRVYSPGEIDPTRDHEVPAIPVGDVPVADVVAPVAEAKHLEPAPADAAPAEAPAQASTDPEEAELKAAFQELRRRGDAKKFTPADFHILLTDQGIPPNDNLGVRMRAATKEQVIQMIANVEFLDPFTPDADPQQTLNGTATEIAAQAPAEGVLA